jgi:signal transduction histidine kinase
VNHHHGQLTVESAKGAGAEFCIELPIALRAESV